MIESKSFDWLFNLNDPVQMRAYPLKQLFFIVINFIDIIHWLKSSNFAVLYS